MNNAPFQIIFNWLLKRVVRKEEHATDLTGGKDAHSVSMKRSECKCF